VLSVEKRDFRRYIWLKRASQERKYRNQPRNWFRIGCYIVSSVGKVLLKNENEEIHLADSILPPKNRTKISTFKISERYQGMRIGEGAVGLALWAWQRKKTEEIYFTVFDKQDSLIVLFEKFGFVYAGSQQNGEFIYVKSRSHIDFSTPYSSFPFISSDFKKAEYVIINDDFHDKIFAYSELATNQQDMQNKIGVSVINGLTKVYIGRAPDNKYEVGDPLLIYRKYTKGSGVQYRSCVTSYGMVTNSFQAKVKGHSLMSVEELLGRIGNKTIFSESAIRNFYSNNNDVTIIEMLYYGFFGAGNNVNQKWLKDHECWPDVYPAGVPLKPDVFIKVLKEGKIDVQNVIID
jgi:hypothetical protein